MTEDRRERLLALAERLGHVFLDLGLLDRALTHTSHANELVGADPRHNEPLEFLGDAVLGFAVAELLHRHSPTGDEGRKTRTRALLVAAPSLGRRAALLGLPALLRLGRGEEKSGGREKAKLWADAFEAVLAALYLDGGLPAVQRFAEAQFAAEVTAGSSLALVDAKSALQEWLHARGEAAPEYRVLAEEGPSHGRQFRVSCLIGGRSLGEGAGSTKKAAQQAAARQALSAVTGDNSPRALS